MVSGTLSLPAKCLFNELQNGALNTKRVQYNNALILLIRGRSRSSIIRLISVKDVYYSSADVIQIPGYVNYVGT